MYDAIRGYKYQHCPVLSGLNKTQLGELVNKFDLNVEPSGKRRRATGKGVGRTWDVDRKKSTWKPKGDRTREGVRYTGLIDKTKPVQTKRKEVAEAVPDTKGIKADVLKNISKRARKPKVEVVEKKKAPMKLQLKKKKKKT